jgi:hypothetical protein
MRLDPEFGLRFRAHRRFELFETAEVIRGFVRRQQVDGPDRAVALPLRELFFGEGFGHGKKLPPLFQYLPAPVRYSP